VTNAAGAGISGTEHGVDIAGAPGVVMNAGTIENTLSGYGVGVYLGAGGTLANAATGLIRGGYGALIEAPLGTPAAVTNAGTIAGGTLGTGVFVYGLATLTNATTGASAAVISGGRNGVCMSNSNSAITNGGTISGGTGAGIVLGAGGQIRNLADGTISGGAEGVSVGASEFLRIDNAGVISGAVGITAASGGITGIINAGTIIGTGGTAVSLGAVSGGGASNNSVALDPGAVFLGRVAAQGTANTLSLLSSSSTGTVSGLGTSFTGFDTVTLGTGAQWLLSGSNSLAGGATIGTGGVLTLGGTLQVGGALSLTGSGTIAVGATGSLEVGGTDGAKSGMFTVDAANTLTGAGTLKGNVLDKGKIVAAGVTLALSRSVTGTGSIAIDPGSVLSVRGKLGVAGLSFLGGGAETLALGKPSLASAKLSGFGVGDTIDLVKTVGTAASFAGGMLTVTGAGGAVATLHFLGSHTSSQFLLGSDHHGGTTISFV
jgi:hypothetical protein